MMDIRPIKTEADYDWAIAEIGKYFENEPEVGSADGDRFDVLATLIEAYENQHYPISAPDPVDAIRSHMELLDLPKKKLVDAIGSPSRASEVMHRKRALTVSMIHRISEELKIPAAVLVQPYRLARAGKTVKKISRSPPRRIATRRKTVAG